VFLLAPCLLFSLLFSSLLTSLVPAAADFLINNGLTKGVCINYEPDNKGMEARCLGFNKTLTAKGCKMTYLIIGKLADANQKAIKAALLADTAINGALICGQSAAGETVRALREVKAAFPSRVIEAGTFDYGASVGAYLSSDDLLFGIHQQQFYQGYLPVVLLTLKNTMDLELLENIVFTGPAFVVKADVKPRQCELAKVCAITKIDQASYVLRAKTGGDNHALRFANATFGKLGDVSTPKYTSLVSASPADGCAPLSNKASVNAGAVLVDEGGCLFTTKARHAQAAGASLVIVARTTAAVPVQMTGVGADLTKPAVCISKASATLLRASATPTVKVREKGEKGEGKGEGGEGRRKGGGRKATVWPNWGSGCNPHHRTRLLASCAPRCPDL